MRTWERMPNIDAILMDPHNAPVPSEPDVLFSVSAALAARAEKGSFGQIVEYVQRLPDEFATMAVKDALRRKPDLQGTRAFNVFAVKYAAIWQD